MQHRQLLLLLFQVLHHLRRSFRQKLLIAQLALPTGDAPLDLFHFSLQSFAECERLKREMEKIERGIAGGQRQLGNEQFLAKAPPQVVENLKKQQQELAVLHQKTQSKLNELGCG